MEHDNLKKYTELEPYDVHKALSDAVLEDHEPMTVFSLRLSVAQKEAAQEICDRHGTSLGAFVRKCVEGLLKDYHIAPREDV